MKAFLRRLIALTNKEFRQMARDPSSIAIGFVLPLVLILIFGYGLSLDVNHVPIAVVTERHSALSRDILAGLLGSPYFSPRWLSSMHEAEELMRQRKVDAILHLGSDFDKKLKYGSATAQVILHGVDSTTATMAGQYISGAVSEYTQKMLARTGRDSMSGSSVRIQGRIWFNEAVTSTWYLVPGLIVIIMTLVGAFLTSLIMAREWERGTLESIFVTPAGRTEILLAKIIPYFFLGMIGLALCLAASRWLFHVPTRGSLSILLLSSALYLVVALGLGLVISSSTRSQFMACQISIIVSFLPTIILSGFLFDLRSIPAGARIIGNILPATHYMNILKTLFLAGDNMTIVLKGCAALTGYVILFMTIAMRLTRKKLD